MKIIDSGTVFYGEENTRKCGNYIPSVFAMSNGEILVCFRSGSGKTTADASIALMISGDMGKTFSEVEFPFDSVYEGKRGSLWSAYASELETGVITMAVFWIDRQTLGSVEWVNSETYGLLPVKTLLYKSRDFGRSWVFDSEIENTSSDFQLPVTNHIYKLSGGTLFCPFEKYKNYYDTKPWQQAAVMKISHDGGRSWDDCTVAARDDTKRLWYNDQRGCVLSGDTIINYYPTFDTQKNEYVNVHMNESNDMGKTWTRPKDTGIGGMSSAPVELPDGRIVICTSDQKTKTVDIYISEDGGESFDTERALTVYSAEKESKKVSDDKDFTE